TLRLRVPSAATGPGNQAWIRTWEAVSGIAPPAPASPFDAVAPTSAAPGNTSVSAVAGGLADCSDQPTTPAATAKITTSTTTSVFLRPIGRSLRTLSNCMQ